MEKVGRHPELRESCIALLEEWLGRSEHQASRPLLLEWGEMLSGWSWERISTVVLDPEEGQTLRQCSPLAAVLTPRERWAALEEIEREPRSAGESA